MSALADGRGIRLGGRWAYTLKDPVWEDEHRRAIEEVLKEDRQASQAQAAAPAQGEAAGEWPPSLDVPVPVPAVTFLADDGSEVASLSANAEGVFARPGAERSSSSRRGGRPPRRLAGLTNPGSHRRDRAEEPPRRPEQPLAFSAAFESGNLFSAKLVRCEDPDVQGCLPHFEYELQMDNDTHSDREHTQWFHFAVYNWAPCAVTFRIANFRKRGSLYRVGMQPHVRALSSGFADWDATCCSEVSYTANMRGRGQYYTLTFRYEFRVAQDFTFFAGHTPYTLGMLRTFLARLNAHPFARGRFAEQELCTSLAGIKVPLLMITEGLPEVCCGKGQDSDRSVRQRLLGEARRKPAVVVIARQHPGETVGSHVVTGFVRFLLGESPDAKALREKFCFHVVPMLNVDGVVHGNSRCTLAGVDPNRCWLNPAKERHPEVFATREYIARAQQTAGVHMFLDLHGHSQRLGAFFYGNCPEQIRSALFPKLVSLGSRDVDFEGSRWRFAKAHNQAARAVVFNHCGVFNSFTLEASFFAQKLPATARGDLSPQLLSRAEAQLTAEARLGGLRDVLFLPRRAETIGRAVGWAMATFFGLEVEVPAADAEPQETKASPWLTYAQLRRATADGVLAALEAAGRTVFDLQGRAAGAGAGDEDFDSDGGPDEEDGPAGGQGNAEGENDKPVREVSPNSRVQRREADKVSLIGADRAQKTSSWMSSRSNQEQQRANSLGITHFTWPVGSPCRASFHKESMEQTELSRCLGLPEGGVAPEWLSSASAARVAPGASQPPSPMDCPPTALSAVESLLSSRHTWATRPPARKARICQSGTWQTLMELAAEETRAAPTTITVGDHVLASASSGQPFTVTRQPRHTSDRWRSAGGATGGRSNPGRLPRLQQSARPIVTHASL